MLQLVVVGKEEGVSLFWTFFLLPYCFDSETLGSDVSVGPEARRGFALGSGVLCYCRDFGAAEQGSRRAGRSIKPKSEVGCVWLFLLLLCRGDLSGCFGLRSLQIGFTSWGGNFPYLVSEPAQVSHVGM